MNDDNRIDFPKAVANDAKRPMPEAPAPKPELLRVPNHFRSVDDALACAAKMDLPNVLVLSERADGSLVFLDNDLTLAQANWLLDRMKALLITPNQFEKTK